MINFAKIWDILITKFPAFMEGVEITLQLAFFTVLFGSLLGLVVAVCRRTRLLPLRWLMNAYVAFIRGTPLLVQVLLVVYGLPQLGIRLPRMTLCIIALVINSGAYMAELIRAGLQSVEKGQVEAAESLAAPAGMYYMPVGDPALPEEEAPLTERLQAAFRLQGLTLSDPVLEAAGMLGPGADTGRGKGLVSRDEFQAVVDYSVAKAKDTLGRIMEGGAAVSPARYKQSDPCKTCRYKGICAFDPQLGCRARGLGSMNKDAFLTAIGKKQEDGHELDG